MTRYAFELQTRGIKDPVIAALIDCTEPTAKNYRVGNTTMPVDKAIRVSEYLGVPVDVLFAEVEQEVNSATIEV